MAKPQVCPDRRDLEQWVLGQLSDPEAEGIGQHVLICSDCGKSLQELGTADPLLRDVRAAASHSFPLELGGADLIERLVANPPPTSETKRAPEQGTVPRDALDERCDAPDPYGRRFGRYTLQKLVGKGGMGAVYLAHDTQLDRPVALKVPRFRAASHGIDEERFLREARAAARLSHPNLCPVFDVGRIDGVSYLAMAYVEGQNLLEYLRTQPRQPIAHSVELVRQLALAMSEAHRRGVIHRDLKPANVMMDRNGRPVVMDFGLARRDLDANDVRLTGSGVIMGTPAYMSPEQVNGVHAAIGPPSDIYSLGVMFYELLTGRVPFLGGLGELLGQIATQPPPAPSRFQPDLDPDLEAICLKAIEKKPASRFSSMEEFADALQQWNRSQSPERTTREDLSGAGRRLSRKVRKKSRAEGSYLKARHYWNKRTEEGLRKSIEYFNRALDQDPLFAAAWAGLADAYHQLGHWGLAPPATAYERGKSAALKAIELDDSLTEAHLALAVVLKDYTWDFSGAAQAFRRALQLEPNHATARQWYGQCLACMGRHDEAILELVKARELDPLGLIHDAVLGRHGYFFARQYEKAQKQLQQTLSTDPDFWIAQNFLGWVLYFQGDVANGLLAMQRAHELDDNPENLVGLGYGHALAQRPAKAAECIDALHARAPIRYVAPINHALIFAALGDLDNAFLWLNQACTEHSQWLSEIRVDPAFDPLRDDPRFDAVLKRMNIQA